MAKVFLENTFVLILSVLGFSWTLVHSQSQDMYKKEFIFDRELMLTKNEKNLLEQFKAAVYQNLTQEFMKQDLYLIRALRAKNLNLEMAINEIFNLLKFWDANNLDNISKETMKDIEEDFPFHSTRDRKNRPVLFGSINSGWNVRRALIQGKRAAVMRYIYKLILGANDEIIQTQKTMANVTTFDIILNMNGFNIFQHGCPMCISVYITLIQTYERFLPQHVHEILIINTPQPFFVVLDMVRPFLSKHTRDRLKIYGTNRGKWQPHLDALVESSHLPWDLDRR